VGQGPLQ
jgi:hypothetical protein